MEKSKVVVVMVPFPAQSHLNQLLNLAVLISSHGLPIHFAGTATHNCQARLRATALQPNATAKIQFHDLHTPPIATPEPNSTASNKDVNHLGPAVLAYFQLRDQIGSLVHQLSKHSTKTVVIYDRLVVQAVEVAVSIPAVESYAFSSLPTLTVFCILWEALGRPFDVEEEVLHLPSVREFIPENALNHMASMPECFDLREGEIYNTFRLIEGKYIDLPRREELGGGKKQWAITPSLFLINKFSNEKKARNQCQEWLDNQAPRSVMYVSFRNTVSLSNEEIREVAARLEDSRKKFIWVVREADKA